MLSIARTYLIYVWHINQSDITLKKKNILIDMNKGAYLPFPSTRLLEIVLSFIVIPIVGKGYTFNYKERNHTISNIPSTGKWVSLLTYHASWINILPGSFTY